MCRLTIELEIRTKAENGLLFYMARINHADFATIQIKNGFPYFSYDLGHGNTSTMIPNKINDGQWHKVVYDLAMHEWIKDTFLYRLSSSNPPLPCSEL